MNNQGISLGLQAGVLLEKYEWEKQDGSKAAE